METKLEKDMQRRDSGWLDVTEQMEEGRVEMSRCGDP